MWREDEMEQADKQVVQLLQSQNRRLMLQNGLLLAAVILIGCLFFLWNGSASNLEPQMEETLERVQEFSMSMNELTRQLNDAEMVNNLKTVSYTHLPVIGGDPAFGETPRRFDLCGRFLWLHAPADSGFASAHAEGGTGDHRRDRLVEGGESGGMGTGRGRGAFRREPADAVCSL